jgi:hypothetical protein
LHARSLLFVRHTKALKLKLGDKIAEGALILILRLPIWVST